jgi:hypothetical protein
MRRRRGLEGWRDGWVIRGGGMEVGWIVEMVGMF